MISSFAHKRIFNVLLISLFAINCYASDDDEALATQRKADFIVDIAAKISYPSLSNAKDYKIGIYGKGKEIKSLYEELESRDGDYSIKGLPVKLYNFKSIRNVEPVDLLYLAGDSKIRISDLNEKLDGHPYIIVTENFPFGTSMLNFAMNKNQDLFFELQSEAIKNKGAKIDNELLSSPLRIKSEKEWEQKLAAAEVVISQQKERIEEQSEEIDEKTKVINYQRIAIIVGVIATLIIVALLLILIRVNQQRKQALKDIIASIKYAKHIQDGVLPTCKHLKEHLPQSFILHKPKDIVSGDFYWLESIGSKLYFAVADCTGHGVPGAMLSVMCINSLNKAVKEMGLSDPGEILDKTTELLEERFSQSEENVTDGMDIALCCLDSNAKQLQFAGANNPLYYISNGELKEIKPDKQPIGKYEYRKPYTTHTIDVNSGTMAYIFSDGYADQFGGPKNKKFTYRKFRETLLAIHENSMDEQHELLDKQIISWKGEKMQIDDICVMGLKF